MKEHPIEGLMITAMDSIRDMIDVNTIVGEPVEAANGITIIPISKVGVGFAAGGSEFKGETIDEYKKAESEEEIQYRLPFGGGSGAGVSINPVAFLVVQNENVRLISVSHTSAVDKLLDYVPDLLEKMNTMMKKAMDKKDSVEEIKLENNDKKIHEKIVKTPDNTVYKVKYKEELKDEEENFDEDE
ncbi:MAG: GerW family sporulation protein [Lachnospiraceae bacterium]|jgi:sporulation protein YtfJ|nr:GerW family sporulation protein [Lachnospiraceae bacterium]